MPTANRYVELAHALWDELADRPIEDSEQGMRYLLERLCTLIGAHNASWVGAVRLSGEPPEDPLRGWRPRIVSFLHPFPELIERAEQDVKNLERGDVDITTVRNVASAGTFRVNRLVDLAPPEWFDSPYYHVTYRNKGREDAMWAGVPVNPDAESHIGVFRGSNVPRFSLEEREAFGYVLRGLKWFIRRQMLSHGLLVAETPLTPAERKVLHGLLTGWTEKEIAAQIGQSYNTTHAHVGILYRKFGVNNRSALMALWIGGGA
jgi:DNA-binding CsgD family transcriptional regulator